jgi:hypothetical protein
MITATTIAIRRKVVVQEDGRVEITAPELTAGETAEVILLVEKHMAVGAPEAAALQKLRALFDATQALPQVQAITEDDIAAEIASYRSGQA